MRGQPESSKGCRADANCAQRFGHNAALLIETIADLVPAAVAIALSPLPIVAIVLVLGTPSARASGIGFAAGWLIGLVVVCIAVVLLARGAEDTHGATSNLLDLGKVALGAVLLVLAARLWSGRSSSREPAKMPAWMAAVAAVRPAGALKLGVLLAVANPKNIILSLTAAASIAQANLGGTDKAIVIGAFALLGSLSILVPVGFYLADADRAAAPLASVKQFMSDNSSVIAMVLLLVLGTKLVADGVAGLLS